MQPKLIRHDWMFQLLVLALVVVGCAGNSDSDLSHEIISKSKESEPVWTKQKHGALIRGSAGYDYVQRVADVTNLPLGIKTTQLTAIDGSRKALIDELHLEATRNLSSSEAKVLKQSSQFTTTLNDLVKQSHAEEAKISDIYFEQYIDTSRSDATANQALYKVYVLVSIPAELMPRLLRDLGGRCKDSQDPAVRAVGASLEARWSTAPSH